MPQVPVLSAQAVVAAFESFGWRVARDGNHTILVKTGSTASLSVPNHKEVARGTLRSLIRDANLTVDQFLQALER